EELDDDADGYDRLEIKRGIKTALLTHRRILNELLRERPINVRAMLEVHRTFIYEDRYEPSAGIYTMLIDACAQVGYTKKAVELFQEMKRFDLKPSNAAVTALFNACANCSYNKEYGLQKALYLRERLECGGHVFNDIQYNV